MKTITPKSKIVYLSTFPPTQCGIATFTEDTLRAITQIYDKSIRCEICEITFNGEASDLADYHIPSKDQAAYSRVAEAINQDPEVELVHIQHEFGLFGGEYGAYLLDFITTLQKPIAFTFHTVLPNPNPQLKAITQLLCSYSEALVVMTEKSKAILIQDYAIKAEKITVIPHGTHLVDYETTAKAKAKLQLEDRLTLATFGLLGEGKSIETGLQALAQVVPQFPNVLYLILGKTHPNTITDGVDHYRLKLEKLVRDLKLESNVRFVNEYLETNQLLDYLKATDIYLFTSKDPNQAVSGTFSYAMSCSCPIVASRIPHTLECLTSDIGILADIQNADQFAEATLRLLSDANLRRNMAINAYAATTKTSWENTALKHLSVYQKIAKGLASTKITYPTININHLKRMTTDLGMIQFCQISEPDLESGYTIDDNARALMAMVKHYQLHDDEADLHYLKTYLNFIIRCQLPEGNFTNYIDQHNQIEARNEHENLEDANGRAVWALGTLMRLNTVKTLPSSMVYRATACLNKALSYVAQLQSPRAMGFAIKGLYALYQVTPTPKLLALIQDRADKIAALYEHTAVANWKWYENKLTYANSVLPEALLLAHLVTDESRYKKIALESLHFLIDKMYTDNQLKIISNQGWHEKNAIPYEYGEQPIEAYYMMNTLDLFYKTFHDPLYKRYLKLAFDWYLGKNHLKQILYNPITGGCYDGLEKENINLNQGAESTVCYLSARLLIETYTSKGKNMISASYLKPTGTAFVLVKEHTKSITKVVETTMSPMVYHNKTLLLPAKKGKLKS
ncbi:glycosyltransferase [Flavobacterium agrisoli]|uniref:Glycosyltransferase n=1 Tax=Flavobacterium agrisoli TaxID=2793066 RepID=A0A934PKL3_9FLAO|nr:glycosyltransferase [Flavobacterium agrisoli]MBK0369897.1 glycosyltransferase [Flavobacterium agrisoli]